MTGAQVWEVHRLLSEGLASGEVVPLLFNIFAKESAADAFRFMAAGARMCQAVVTAQIIGLWQKQLLHTCTQR